jgi:hypothetical protein
VASPIPECGNELDAAREQLERIHNVVPHEHNLQGWSDTAIAYWFSELIVTVEKARGLAQILSGARSKATAEQVQLLSGAVAKLNVAMAEFGKSRSKANSRKTRIAKARFDFINHLQAFTFANEQLFAEPWLRSLLGRRAKALASLVTFAETAGAIGP